jgi:hypothetical protein
VPESCSSRAWRSQGSSHQRSNGSRRQLEQQKGARNNKQSSETRVRTERVRKSKLSDTKPAEFIANMSQATAEASSACLRRTRELMNRRRKDQRPFLLLLPRNDVDRPCQSRDVYVQPTAKQRDETVQPPVLDVFHCRPFQSLLQMKVRQRNSVPCSLSPDGPNGRAHMKKDLPASGVSQDRYRANIQQVRTDGHSDRTEKWVLDGDWHRDRHLRNEGPVPTRETRVLEFKRGG